MVAIMWGNRLYCCILHWIGESGNCRKDWTGSHVVDYIWHKAIVITSYNVSPLLNQWLKLLNDLFLCWYINNWQISFAARNPYSKYHESKAININYISYMLLPSLMKYGTLQHWYVSCKNCSIILSRVINWLMSTLKTSSPFVSVIWVYVYSHFL